LIKIDLEKNSRALRPLQGLQVGSIRVLAWDAKKVIPAINRRAVASAGLEKNSRALPPVSGAFFLSV